MLRRLFQRNDKSESTEQEFRFPCCQVFYSDLFNEYFKVKIYNMCFFTKDTFSLLFTLSALS